MWRWKIDILSPGNYLADELYVTLDHRPPAFTLAAPMNTRRIIGGFVASPDLAGEMDGMGRSIGTMRDTSTATMAMSGRAIGSDRALAGRVRRPTRWVHGPTACNIFQGV
jgi:hypothetical protein